MVEQSSHVFISTDELQTLINNGHPLCILDCTVLMAPGEDAVFTYGKEHIHGAKFLDLKLCRDLQNPFPFMMPNKDYFTMIAKSLDIRKSHTVVCYDSLTGALNSAFANRGSFMLKAFGHPDVRILDGGLAKWKAEGKPVHGCKAVATPDDFSYELDASKVKSYEDIVEISKNGSAQIVDNRPSPGFQGGNIPTSVNVPAPAMWNADGTLKSADDLRKAFDGAGVDLSKPMVFTCGGGIMATVGYHAARIAGATGSTAVYDGSWNEYSVRSKQ